MRTFFLLLLFLTFLGPISILLKGTVDLHGDYRTANRDSAHLAPDPALTPEAVIQIYAARTFNWRGIFAVHTWIAVKPKLAQQYTVYQSIGWRLYKNLPPLVTALDVPDRNWFAQKPTLLLDIRGAQADALIPQIAQAVAHYPEADKYAYWPGPNSNTFTASIGREVPNLHLVLPSNAVGKDYLTGRRFFAAAPSHTGYQFSFYGIFGVMLARQEGLEINLLGLVYGFSPVTRVLKLPGFGDIPLHR